MENKPNQTQQPAQQNNTIMAVLAYLGILIIVPFLTAAKNDPFVKYHLKQGLALIIFEVVTWFVEVIPFIGYLVGWIFWLASLVFIIIGIMNAAQNKEQELPVIGQYAKNFNF
jgi:uncharacterized membrane protein